MATKPLYELVQNPAWSTDEYAVARYLRDNPNSRTINNSGVFTVARASRQMLKGIFTSWRPVQDNQPRQLNEAKVTKWGDEAELLNIPAAT